MERPRDLRKDNSSYTTNISMARNKFRFSQTERVYLLQAKLRIQTLEAQLDVKKGQVITFDQIVRVQKEIDDFKRFLKRNHRDENKWIRYFQDDE